MMLDKLYEQQKVSYLEILSIDSLGQEILTYFYNDLDGRHEPVKLLSEHPALYLSLPFCRVGTSHKNQDEYLHLQLYHDLFWKILYDLIWKIFYVILW